MESVDCPQCRTSVSLRLEALGKELRCKNCKATYLPLAQIPALDLEWQDVNFDLYMLQVEGLSAFGYISEDDQFAVVRGSKFCRHPDDDLSRLYVLLRDDLIENGILLEDSNGQYYTLTETYCFDDYHTAASLIIGQDEDGDLMWTLIDEEEHSEFNEEDEDCEDESVDDDCQYNEGVHFLDFSRDHIRKLIVEVLEMRPNNSVKKDELVTEILRHIGVRTSGGPRLQFTSQVMLEAQWLSRQKVLKRYKVKNNRVRLTDFYRTQLLLTSNLSESASHSESDTSIDERTSVPETIEALKAENARLRKIIAMLALEGVANDK